MFHRILVLRSATHFIAVLCNLYTTVKLLLLHAKWINKIGNIEDNLLRCGR